MQEVNREQFLKHVLNQNSIAYASISCAKEEDAYVPNAF